MKKYFTYNKKTKKVTMISDTAISIDKDIFTTKEITLTPTKLKDYTESSNYLFYDRGLKIILPDKIKKKQDIIKKLKDKDTTLEDTKAEIIKLITL